MPSFLRGNTAWADALQLLGLLRQDWKEDREAGALCLYAVLSA